LFYDQLAPASRGRRRPETPLGFPIDPKHIAAMPETDEQHQQPVMLPFRDKDGSGWHVIIRYPEGHERLIEGFATEEEALAWIVENTGQLDE
jgi:hypothetical protein